MHRRRSSEKFSIYLLTIALTLLIVGMVLVIVVPFRLEAEVLDFKHYSAEAVTAWYRKNFNDCQNLRISEVYDEEVAAGELISQSLKEGEILKRDQELVIVFSKGPDPELVVKLPDLKKETYDRQTLTQYLTAHHFKDISYEYVIADAAFDTVVKLNVQNEAKRSTAILITLSAGDKLENIKTTVPDLTKYSLANAQAWASAAAVKLDLEFIFAEQAKDAIIKQSIAPGMLVKGGTKLTLTISKGPAVTLLDFSGLSLAEAEAWAKQHDILLYTKKVYTSRYQAGTIFDQNPAADSKIAAGSAVEVTISKGSDPSTLYFTLADYRGKSEDEFLTYLHTLKVEDYTAKKIRKTAARYDDQFAAGSVAWHTQGEVKVTSYIEYYLSLGQYLLKAENFENKVYKTVLQTVKELNEKGAGISFTADVKEYNEVSKDHLFNCQAEGKYLTCRYSLGPYAYDAASFVGLTLAEAEQKIAEANKQGLSLKLEIIAEDFNDQYPEGVLCEAEFDGETLNVKLSKGKAYFIYTLDFYSKDTYQKTHDALVQILGEMKLTIIAIDPKDTPYAEFGDGVIVEMTVNGKKDYAPGYYPASTEIIAKVIKDGL